MPVLESEQIIFKESRLDELLKLKKIFSQYQELILNIRIGATDFSRVFSLRRPVTQSIYDVLPVRGCIEDIINIFGRAHSEFVLSAPVWEYFIPLHEPESDSYQTMMHEVRMDMTNGLVGKTVIHPDQIPIVQAMHTVSEEDFLDATSIMKSFHSGHDGVQSSPFRNKMNEPKPHQAWAQKTLHRANLYGVRRNEYSPQNIIQAHNHLKNRSHDSTSRYPMFAG
jgi:citrate lyase beta subunit